MTSKKGYVFDTTSLNYFARTNCLHLLRDNLTASHIPKEVAIEVDLGISEYPDIAQSLMAIREADWLQTLEITELDNLDLFARLIRRWGKVDRNKGEAAALVLAKRYDLVAVVDDAVARRAATTYGIPYIGTVGLLAMFAANGSISPDEAWQYHDEMTRLPLGPYWSPISSRAEFDVLLDSMSKRVEL
ncbi:MAG TPA: hypothetical protein VGK02_07715 [Candidatus Aquicultor sp.]|jgi:predicted nucleic acid-binding protein